MSTISIIGSGKAASFLAKAFSGATHKIDRIYSRSIANGEALARKYNAEYKSLENEILIGSDFTLLAISDSAISKIAPQIKTGGILLHHSGATGLEVLNMHKNHGVLWPVYSLKEDSDSDRTIPIKIEGSNKESLDRIHSLAASISDHVSYADSRQRLSLHLAAVFAANFTNYLYHSAWLICQKQSLSFEEILPLIKQHINELGYQDPALKQTGPALRHDQGVMEQHQRLIVDLDMPEELGLYRSLSALIGRLSQQL